MAKLTQGLRDVSRASLGWTQGFALFFAFATPFYFCAVVFGVRMEFWSWRLALDPLLHVIGPILIGACLLAGILSLAGVAVNLFFEPRAVNSLVAPLLALLVAVISTVWTVQAHRARAAAPMVLDVTTDPAEPPAFSAGFHARREPWATALDYGAKHGPDGRPLHALQHEFYPGLVTLDVQAPVGETVRVAMRIARDQGWRVGAASPQTGQFEATAESLWMGFRDDMAVRITPHEDGGSRMDIRILSRTEVHDLGRVARRARRYLDAMRQEMAPNPDAVWRPGAATPISEP